VKIDRKILEPYFPIRRSSEHQNNEQQKDTNNTNNKIDFRAFQEGVVEYDTFEKICSEWMEREEEGEGRGDERGSGGNGAFKARAERVVDGLVLHHKDVFVSHVLSKLNTTDRYFFWNGE